MESYGSATGSATLSVYICAQNRCVNWGPRSFIYRQGKYSEHFKGDSYFRFHLDTEFLTVWHVQTCL